MADAGEAERDSRRELVRRKVRLPGLAVLALSLVPFVPFVVGACGSREQLVVDDLAGRPTAPLEGSDARAVVLLFAAVTCPISNYFAPEAERIHAAYDDRGVDFYLVYADADTPLEDIRRHVADFGYTMPVLLDFDHLLVEHTGATVTPEAVVLSMEGEVLYRGRIDDTYVDFGKQRAAPTRRDLREALDAILAGRRPEVERTEPVGCFIPSV